MTERKTFIKLMSPEGVKRYLDEARRVKYLVDKDDISFKVTDDETQDMVMRGVRMNRRFYAVTFSKLYWEEPEIPVGAL